VSAHLVRQLVFAPREKWRWTSLSQIAVLQAIAAFHDDKRGYAWPAISTLAQYLKISERHVQRVLRELERLGLICVTARQGGRRRGSGRSGQSSCYEVLFIDAGADHAERVTSETAKGDTQGAKGDTQGAERVTPVSPDLQTDLQGDLQREEARQRAPSRSSSASIPLPSQARGKVAFKSRRGLDVPWFLHTEFVERVMHDGMTQLAAEQHLHAFYTNTISNLPGGIIAGESKDFWKAAFDANVANLFPRTSMKASVAATNSQWARRHLAS